MNPYLLAGIVAIVLNVLTVCATLFMQLNALKPRPKSASVSSQHSVLKRKPQLIIAYWNEQSKEIDSLIENLKEEKHKLNDRKQSLDEKESMLNAEKKEIERLKNSLENFKTQISQTITEIETAEQRNIKSLAETYMALSPESAIPVLLAMEEVLMLKILYTMSTESVALIFDNMSSTGRPEMIKLVADLSEKLRLIRVVRSK